MTKSQTGQARKKKTDTHNHCDLAGWLMNRQSETDTMRRDDLTDSLDSIQAWIRREEKRAPRGGILESKISKIFTEFFNRLLFVKID